MYYWNQITSIASNYFYTQTNVNQDNINLSQNLNNNNIDTIAEKEQKINLTNVGKEPYLNAELADPEAYKEYFGSRIYAKQTPIWPIASCEKAISTDTYQYTESLKPFLVDKGYSYRRVMSDGNCLFYSFSYMLLRNAIENNTLATLIENLSEHSKTANDYLKNKPQFKGVPLKKNDTTALEVLEYLNNNPKEFYYVLNNPQAILPITNLLRKILGVHILTHTDQFLDPDDAVHNTNPVIQCTNPKAKVNTWGDLNCVWAFNELFQNRFGAQPILVLNNEIKQVASDLDPKKAKVTIVDKGEIGLNHHIYQPLAEASLQHNPKFIIHHDGAHFGVFENLGNDNDNQFDKDQKAIDSSFLPTKEQIEITDYNNYSNKITHAQLQHLNEMLKTLKRKRNLKNYEDIHPSQDLKV